MLGQGENSSVHPYLRCLQNRASAKGPCDNSHLPGPRFPNVQKEMAAGGGCHLYRSFIDFIPNI